MASPKHTQPKSLAKTSRGDLAKYDPNKGIKKIAVLEMAEKHWSKAKDADQLRKAIRAKLEAQAEFVLWWKTQGPGTNHGGSERGQGRQPKSS